MFEEYEIAKLPKKKQVMFWKMAVSSTKQALKRSFAPRPGVTVKADPNMGCTPTYDATILNQGNGPLMERLFNDLMAVSKPY